MDYNKQDTLRSQVLRFQNKGFFFLKVKTEGKGRHGKWSLGLRCFSGWICKSSRKWNSEAISTFMLFSSVCGNLSSGSQRETQEKPVLSTAAHTASEAPSSSLCELEESSGLLRKKCPPCRGHVMQIPKWRTERGWTRGKSENSDLLKVLCSGDEAGAWHRLSAARAFPAGPHTSLTPSSEGCRWIWIMAPQRDAGGGAFCVLCLFLCHVPIITHTHFPMKPRIPKWKTN